MDAIVLSSRTGAKSMSVRTYSPVTLDALRVMAGLIRLYRSERGLSVQNLADRLGVSRGLVQRIEAGNPKCEIGVVFEVATLLGIQLFSPSTPLADVADHIGAKIAVLPKAIHRIAPEVNNDF
jgi:ribosome-binding protein aMBF1 (putative translation factor)